MIQMCLTLALALKSASYVHAICTTSGFKMKNALLLLYFRLVDRTQKHFPKATDWEYIHMPRTAVYPILPYWCDLQS